MISCVWPHDQVSQLPQHVAETDSVFQRLQAGALTSALVPERVLGSSPPLIAPSYEDLARQPYAKVTSKVFLLTYF